MFLHFRCGFNWFFLMTCAVCFAEKKFYFSAEDEDESDDDDEDEEESSEESGKMEVEAKPKPKKPDTTARAPVRIVP